MGFYLSDARDCAKYFARGFLGCALTPRIYTVAVSLMLPCHCRRSDLSNDTAALVAREAMRSLYDGVVIYNGPWRTLFVMVFWPRCLRVLSVEEVAG